MHWKGEAFFVSSPVVGLHSAGCARLSTDLVGCALALEISSNLREPSTHAFTPIGVGGYCLVPEVPLIRGLLTVPKVFLTMRDMWASALQLDPP